MSPLYTTYLIARREFVTRVRTRVFIIGTAVVLLALTGFVLLQTVVLKKQDTAVTYKVAFVGQAQQLADPLTAAAKGLGFKIDRHSVSDQPQGESEIRNGNLDALIAGSLGAPQMIVRDTHLTTLQAALQSIVQQEAFSRALTDAGVNPAAIQAQVAAANVQVTSLQPANANRIALVIGGFIVALFLYVALLTYGTFIAQGVVEEKANRIVEILLSTVRPEQLLIGKVAGIGMVGLLQFTLIGLTGFVLASVTHIFSVPTDAAGIVLAGLLWFILGYFLYAILFAAAGSLVSRQEEVQSVVLPITMLTVLTWFVAIGVLTPEFDGQP
ncbi:MAG TPA: ABC transporter permease, partial [Candidatus Dormibacteraeota bacterium]